MGFFAAKGWSCSSQGDERDIQDAGDDLAALFDSLRVTTLNRHPKVVVQEQRSPDVIEKHSMKIVGALEEAKVAKRGM